MQSFTAVPLWLRPPWRIFRTGDLAGVPNDAADWLERRCYASPFPCALADATEFKPMYFTRNWSLAFYREGECEYQILERV